MTDCGFSDCSVSGRLFRKRRACRAPGLLFTCTYPFPKSTFAHLNNRFQQRLAQMLSRLIKIAEEFNVAVYMTNQGKFSVSWYNSLSFGGRGLSFLHSQVPIGCFQACNLWQEIVLAFEF